VCELFGVEAYANEGLLDHSLHTVLLDRKKNLVANIEGNQFTAAELGDLTASLLR
jgi:protein SCO1/2